MLAEYQCQTCDHRWRGKPGRVTCPICVRIDPDIETWKLHYVRWLNYDEMFGTRDVAKEDAARRGSR